MELRGSTQGQGRKRSMTSSSGSPAGQMRRPGLQHPVSLVADGGVGGSSGDDNSCSPGACSPFSPPRGGLLCLKPLLFLTPEPRDARVALGGVLSLPFLGLLENLGGSCVCRSVTLAALYLSPVAPGPACDLFWNFYDSLTGAALDPGSNAPSRPGPWTVRGTQTLTAPEPSVSSLWGGLTYHGSPSSITQLLRDGEGDAGAVAVASRSPRPRVPPGPRGRATGSGAQCLLTEHFAWAPLWAQHFLCFVFCRPLGSRLRCGEFRLHLRDELEPDRRKVADSGFTSRPSLRLRCGDYVLCFRALPLLLLETLTPVLTSLLRT